MNPHLTFDMGAALDPRHLGTLIAPADDEIWGEVKLGPTTAHLCSGCGTHVRELYYETLHLECETCGARWADFDPALVNTAELGEIEADAWNAEKLPQQYADYILTFGAAA